MAFKSIEDIIGQTVRRDISRMEGFAQGGLEHAARSIMSTPNAHLDIVTGFFIRNAVPRRRADSTPTIRPDEGGKVRVVGARRIRDGDWKTVPWGERGKTPSTPPCASSFKARRLTLSAINRSYTRLDRVSR
jgi:hypothetical protein